MGPMRDMGTLEQLGNITKQQLTGMCRLGVHQHALRHLLPRKQGHLQGHTQHCRNLTLGNDMFSINKQVNESVNVHSDHGLHM